MAISELAQIGLRGVGIEDLEWDKTTGGARVTFRVRRVGSNELFYSQTVDIPNLWLFLQPLLGAMADAEFELFLSERQSTKENALPTSDEAASS